MKKKWVKLLQLPQQMILDGRRVRYKKRVLGYIRSGWGCGLWLTPSPEYSNVVPWFPPGGKSIKDVASDIEVETEGEMK